MKQMTFLDLKSSLAALALLALIAAPAMLAEEMKLKNCPAPVQDAAHLQAGTGKVDDDVKTVMVGDRLVYVVEVERANGSDVTLHLDGTGVTLKSREEMKLELVPPAVLASARQMVPAGGKLDDEAHLETVNGVVAYEVEIERPNQPDLKVVIGVDGVVVDQR